MDELLRFLQARLDEDEAAAKAASGDEAADWHWTPAVTAAGRAILVASGEWDDTDIAQVDQDADDLAEHIARHDPARVLREVAAKRALLAVYEGFSHPVSLLERATYPSFAEVLRGQVRHLAAVYSDHPDYRGEWKP